MPIASYCSTDSYLLYAIRKHADVKNLRSDAVKITDADSAAGVSVGLPVRFFVRVCVHFRVAALYVSLPKQRSLASLLSNRRKQPSRVLLPGPLATRGCGANLGYINVLIDLTIPQCIHSFVPFCCFLTTTVAKVSSKRQER